MKCFEYSHIYRTPYTYKYRWINIDDLKEKGWQIRVAWNISNLVMYIELFIHINIDWINKYKWSKEKRLAN